MRIVVDLQALQSYSRFGGIGRYTQNLIEAMMEVVDRDDEIYFVVNDNFKNSIGDVYGFLSGVDRERIRVFKHLSPVSNDNRENRERHEIAKVLYEHFIFSLRPDICFIPSLVEGFGDDVITSVGVLGYGDITVSVMYDLIPLVQSELYLQYDLAREHYMGKIERFKDAGLLLSISEFARDEAIELLEIEPQKIINISSAIDDKFVKREFGGEYRERLYEKLGIDGKYLLYTASFDIRKNQERLIEAFGKIDKSVRDGVQLVLVGKATDDVYAHYKKVIKSHNLDERDVILAKHLDDEELLCIYNGAFGFVFASLSEGFGLPALEAMACGVAVIGSNTTSLPEVICADEARFDPYSVDEMSKKIERLISDEAFRERLVSIGSEHCKNFSWKKSATVAVKSMRELHNKMGKSDFSDLDERAYKRIEEIIKDKNEALIAQVACAFDKNITASGVRGEKIGWISSYNSRCGIASYSKHLIGDRDVIVYAPRDGDVKDETRRLFDMATDDLVGVYDDIVACGVGSVVIQFNYGFFNFYYLNLFVKKLASIGVRVYMTLHSTSDTVEKELVWLQEALWMSQMVFVHSDVDVKRLADIGVSKNVRKFNQPIVDIEGGGVESIKNGEVVFATYGFMLPHKGLMETLKAFEIVKKRFDNVKLVMLNALYPKEFSYSLRDEIESYIKSKKIEDVVMMSDYMDDKESIGYLQQADAAVFGYQVTGESSSAAVRMAIASEISIIATPLEIFGDIKEMVHFSDGVSVESIASAMVEFVEKMGSDEHNMKLERVVNHHRENSYSRLSQEFFGYIR